MLIYVMDHSFSFLLNFTQSEVKLHTVSLNLIKPQFTRLKLNRHVFKFSCQHICGSSQIFMCIIFFILTSILFREEKFFLFLVYCVTIQCALP